MINHNDDKIREWYQEGEVIHKVMGGGYLIYQRLTNSNIDPGTSYRWITLSGANDYICDGTTKYTKQQKQVSHDYQATWENVVPAVYRKGTVIEYNSVDCGYVPVVIQYRWVNLDPSTDFYCSGTTKMYKQQKQESSDSGQTWSNVVPAEFRMGGSAQTQCEECGYIPPIEPQYRTTSGTPYCSGVDKYVDVYSQVSYDGGSTWTTTATTRTLVEKDCAECGYVPPVVGTKFYGTYSDGREYELPCDSSDELDGREIPYDNEYLTTAFVGDCVKTIRYTTFAGSPSLSAATLSEGLEELAVNVFASCTSLSGITLPNSLVDISNQVFLECTALTDITIPSGVTVIDSSCFRGCTSLSSITFNSQTTRIGQSCFSGCTALRHITIPNRITVIKDTTFYGSGLEDITIPDKITSIGMSAFFNCKSLTSVTIGSGCEIIKSYAFFGCENLQEIVINRSTPPSIGNLSGMSPFGGSTCPIYVPDFAVNKYKTDYYWEKNGYADRIKPISERP